VWTTSLAIAHRTEFAAASIHEALAPDLDAPETLKIQVMFAEKILAADRSGRAVQAAQYTLRSIGPLFGLRLGDAEADAAGLAG
jgi:hypothetical protein